MHTTGLIECAVIFCCMRNQIIHIYEILCSFLQYILLNGNIYPKSWRSCFSTFKGTLPQPRARIYDMHSNVAWRNAYSTSGALTGMISAGATVCSSSHFLMCAPPLCSPSRSCVASGREYDFVNVSCQR